MGILGGAWTAACLVLMVSALTPAEWRGQSIYQVMTDRFARTDGSTSAACNTGAQVYCGGSWQGLIDHLDYIQGMGFTAVWISPVVENLPQNAGDGEAYHGYWAQDIYSVNPHFGTASDLIALSAALHARGMYLMVDVVTNHMGYAGCGTCVDYSVFNPFNSQSYYHPFCLIDYNNANSIKVCWEGDNIVSLPDLRTEDSDVLSTWESWITQLVANYTIDGLRVDSAQQVDNAFFPPFESAAGVYIVGEVFNGGPSYVCPYQEYMSGVLNYPTYYWITQAFESTSGSISNLVNGINTMKSTCSDTTLLGSFLENHDNPRFPSYTSDLSLTRNAIAFTMLQDGIPIIYQGQEQHYTGGDVPYNREAIWSSGYSTSATLHTWISAINAIRTRAISQDNTYLTYQAYPVYSDSSTIVMRKGNSNYQIISVFSNLGASGSSYTLTLSSSETGFTASQSLIEVTSCTRYTTDSNGNLAVSMASGLPRIFYPQARLTGSGICTSIIGPTTTSSVRTASTTLSTSTTRISSSSTGCTTPTSVAVTFDEIVTTSYGETIRISGNVPALGNWASASAVALSSSRYTSSNPLWYATINLSPGAVVQYKYIRVASSGSVTWEADPNHTITVPSCATATTVSNTWRS